MPMIEGMVLFPGAGGTKEHATLVALQDSLSPVSYTHLTLPTKA